MPKFVCERCGGTWTMGYTPTTVLGEFCHVCRKNEALGLSKTLREVDALINELIATCPEARSIIKKHAQRNLGGN